MEAPKRCVPHFILIIRESQTFNIRCTKQVYAVPLGETTPFATPLLQQDDTLQEFLSLKFQQFSSDCGGVITQKSWRARKQFVLEKLREIQWRRQVRLQILPLLWRAKRTPKKSKTKNCFSPLLPLQNSLCLRFFQWPRNRTGTGTVGTVFAEPPEPFSRNRNGFKPEPEPSFPVKMYLKTQKPPL